MQNRSNLSLDLKIMNLGDLVVRNVSIGVGTASILYPIDLIIHALHSKVHAKSLPQASIQPTRLAVLAAAWTSYKYAVTGATMKVTTKQQTQGAKAYLLDEKFKPSEETFESIETELIESKMANYKGLRSTATGLAVSMFFGLLEAFFTQANANNAILSREKFQATKQGRQFDLPQLTNFQSKMSYRIAGLPIRALKSSLQVGAFMATDAIEKKLVVNGYDKTSAKCLSIGLVSSMFGFGINASSLCHTQQIIRMNTKTMAVDSTKTILTDIMKHSGPKGLMTGAGTAIFYTAVVQTVVPMMETCMEKNLPKNSMSFFAKSANANETIESTIEKDQYFLWI